MNGLSPRRAALGLAIALPILTGPVPEGAAPPPGSPSATAPPWASDRPLPDPDLFAPGVISTGDYESHAAFSPDGKSLYYLKDTPDFSFWTIVEAHFENGRWSEPEVAPFSGRHSDADPFLTADGSRFFFISNRPTGNDPKEDLDIWVMDRAPGGWSEPRNLGAPVNSPGNEWYPTSSADGTLYFGSDREGGLGATDLYRCRMVEGKYAAAENLGDPINSRFQEFEPFIAPDQGFLVFMSARPGGQGGFDLYLSHWKDGAWTPPRNLGPKINSSGNELAPKLTPDGRLFFWTSTRGFGASPLAQRLSWKELAAKLRGPGNGLGDIYRIDRSALDVP